MGLRGPPRTQANLRGSRARYSVSTGPLPSAASSLVPGMKSGALSLAMALLCAAAAPRQAHGLMFQSKAVTSQWDTWAFGAHRPPAHMPYGTM